ncbi:hypothetical protein C4K26_3661 [Pseudomonas chlororaphis]|uniref:hypothetical protein n=1 Tax=Pseudomonas chlororaphis TaxID=587753 RepID=UPI000F58E4A6|nr:hypothetical protein [Pseudomonas chlororaphis]AZD09061.1 hypothetical protein C4K26_3661 [Pseudomonas chlororaphis]
MDGIRWYLYPKDSLPEALLNTGTPEQLNGKEITDPKSAIDELTFGYPTQNNLLDYNPPSILILPEYRPAEILAWLKIYAPETSPISQFARIISRKDFLASKEHTPIKNRSKENLDRWASIVLGEILAQGEPVSSISLLPLSRAQASFSNAVAKASTFYGNEYWTNSCVSRLEYAEADRRFISRTLTIRELKPIWDRINTNWNTDQHITTIIKALDTSASANNDLFLSSEPLSYLQNYSDLLSDSVEARVIAFRKIASNLINRPDTNTTDPNLASSLAMAVFLVGRSTSHAFLLSSIGKEIPSVYAWFGLIAGIAGPKYWDIEWTRAAKGIEKGLRGNLNWIEPSHADLSWSEYEWLTTTYRGNNPFLDLPKQLPKVLALEVIPGAVCQLRLKPDTSVIQEPTPNAEPSSKELLDLRETLESFVKLAEKAKSYLANKKTPAKQKTTSLPRGKSIKKITTAEKKI